MISLNKTDYNNLLAIMSGYHYEGIQTAAAGVALFNKIQILAQAPEDSADGADNADRAKPRAAKSAGNAAA